MLQYARTATFTAKPVVGAVAEPVGDGITAVAAEILARDLHARCRLTALVFGNIEQVFDTVDQFPIVAAR